MQTCMKTLTLEGSVYFKYSVLQKHLTLPLIFNNIEDVPPHFMCCIKLSEAIHAQEQLTGLSETSYLIESHV